MAINRRDLGKLLAGAGAAGGSARARPAARRTGAERRRLAPVEPRHLAPGDTVGMVLPASLAFEASTLDLAREQLEAVGFRVKLGRNARQRHGYLAGTDAERAADLMAMFNDPEVAGIFCFRGGWGTPRLLPLLDYDEIRRQSQGLRRLQRHHRAAQRHPPGNRPRHLPRPQRRRQPPPLQPRGAAPGGDVAASRSAPSPTRRKRTTSWSTASTASSP